MNFDLRSARGKRFLQLNELKEIKIDAYENARIYKKRSKIWHGKHVRGKEFKNGDLVLLYNFRLRFFLRKLKSRWSSPFKVIKVILMKLWTFGVRIQEFLKLMVKGYIIGQTVENGTICFLNVPPLH